MQNVIVKFFELLSNAIEIWIAGGWAMIAIAIVAVVMFGLGVHIWLRLLRTRYLAVPERRWRRWIVHPNERRGPVGRVLNAALSARSLDEIALVFEDIRATRLKPFERDLRVMKICVAVAPLLGLLGTVTGMLTTFGALATGSGGDKTMAMIAGGIKEALITTETGLIIALPGLFMTAQLVRRHERLKAFLAHVETVCTQHLYKQLRSTRSARHRPAPTTTSEPVVLAAAT